MRLSRAAGLTAVVIGLLAVAGCRRSQPPPGLGRRIVSGAVQALRPSADGRYLAYLDGCLPLPRGGLPPDAALCDLSAVPADGGEVQRVARGVSTLPGSFGWSGEGHVLAALESYDAPAGAGRLVAWTPGGPPRTFGDGISFWAFAPRGRLLAYSWRGKLDLWRPGGDPEVVEGPAGVASFELHPQAEGDSTGSGAPLLLARSALAAGGGLHLLRAGMGTRQLGQSVGDYGFSPDGEWIAFTERDRDGHALRLVAAAAPERMGPALGEGVTSFSFSRDGAALAFIAGVAPGRQGDLWVVQGRGRAARPERLAREVGELRWARGAPALAWLEQYDPRGRAGTLAVAALGAGGKAGGGAAPRTLGHNVSAFELAPDGSSVAFLEHVTQGGYSVDLKMAVTSAVGEADAGAVRTIARGVFGFDYAPDGRSVWYRTACTRNAEACDLYAVAVAPGAPPRRIAEGPKSFEFDGRRPGRALLGWSRQERVALDLAVWEDGKVIAVDRSALPGSAFLLAPDSARLAYVVNDPRRAGVYVADLPR